MDIEIQDLCKCYGEHAVFSHFFAHFPVGQISGIMGPSGAGKTTLLRILLGLEKADSGTLIGLDVRKAAVFQENRLFEDFSPLSNVAAVLPGRVNRQEIAVHLETLGLDCHPNAPVRTLSGGMKRRVALARGVLAPAQLLVLDEPFTGLDAETKQRVLGFVQAQRKGKTILLVTHDAEECAYFQAPILHLSLPKIPPT